MFISALLERNRRFAATDIRTQAPAIPFIPNQLSFVIPASTRVPSPRVSSASNSGDAIVERVVGGRVTPAILQDVAYISYLVETKAPAGPWQVLPSQNPAGVSGAGATPDVVLLSHPADGPGGCAGLPAGTDGKVPAAFVVLGEPAPLHEVSAYPAERAAPYKRLRALEAVARSPGRRRARPCGAGPRTQDALSASRARDRCRTKPPLGISSRDRAERFPVAKATPGDTGRQVWNRQRTDRDLVDAGDIVLGHEPVQRWNLPDGWVISHKPAHLPLVSETDFIAAQDINAARGPAPGIGLTAPQKRCYFLAGLLICGGCGRKMESAWSNGKPEWWQSCSRLTPPGYRGSLGVHGCVSAGQTVRLASGSSWPGTVKTHVNSLTRKLGVAAARKPGPPSTGTCSPHAAGGAKARRG